MDVDLVIHLKSGPVTIPRAGKMRGEFCGTALVDFQGSALKTVVEVMKREGVLRFGMRVDKSAEGRYTANVWPLDDAPKTAPAPAAPVVEDLKPGRSVQSALDEARAEIGGHWQRPGRDGAVS